MIVMELAETSRRRGTRTARLPPHSMFCTCSGRSAGKAHGCWVSGIGVSGGYTCGYTGFAGWGGCRVRATVQPVAKSAMRSCASSATVSTSCSRNSPQMSSKAAMRFRSL